MIHPATLGHSACSVGVLLSYYTLAVKRSVGNEVKVVTAFFSSDDAEGSVEEGKVMDGLRIYFVMMMPFE